LNEHGKIYWHQAFFEALQLELYQYKDVLKFINEHMLSKEALRMDVLVIKKEKDVQIKKNIGRLFKEHNIFEYKSESDSFSLWDYNKILGIAFLYSSFSQVLLSDITVSIALTIFPRKLVKFLKNERGLNVRHFSDGIYHIDGDIVPIQIIESNCARKGIYQNLPLASSRNKYQKLHPVIPQLIRMGKPYGECSMLLSCEGKTQDGYAMVDKVS